jgi:hypothetical protein
MRLTLLAAAFFLTFAGCAGTTPSMGLDAVFGDDVDPDATEGPLMVMGMQLEGRIGEGPWGATADMTVTAGNVDGPRMSAPNALGGGGETTELSIPENATATMHVRLVKAANLTGYTAHYFVTGYDGVPDNATPAASLPADAEFTQQLSSPGAYYVHAVIAKDGADASEAEAVLVQPFVARLMVKWTATGDVQPQNPGSGVPWPTSRDAMTDKYAIELPAGLAVQVTTTFRGTWTPDQGTDVDIGLYSPDGAGVICAAGTLDPTSAVDPIHANESFTGLTDAAGVWTIEVGAMQNGCGGGGNYSYANAGPVPYNVEIVVG